MDKTRRALAVADPERARGMARSGLFEQWYPRLATDNGRWRFAWGSKVNAPHILMLPVIYNTGFRCSPDMVEWLALGKIRVWGIDDEGALAAASVVEGPASALRRKTTASSSSPCASGGAGITQFQVPIPVTFKPLLQQPGAFELT